ncbi:hypothetical protein BC829DRAFT_269329 [Chytridium lagenaria]|nr:hypothetical protein BC829DRAFT_269329 [Chytridium lagenaria]
MVVILLVVNLVFLLLLRSLHMRHLETEWEICNVSVNSVNVFMGLRKLETFSRNTSSLSEEFLYNNFRMHLATASSAGFRATKSLWMKAIDEGGEKLNMLQDPTLVIRQIFPYRVMPQNASLTSIPLMVSILRGFSGSGVISDYNLIDQISHAKGSSFYDRTRFILDNFLGTSYDEGHVKPSMFDSWRSIDIVAKNDLLSIVYVLIFVTLIVLIYFAFALIQNGLAKLIEQQQNALNVFKCIPKLYVDQMLTVARNAAASVKQQQIGDMASDIVSPFAIQQQQQRPVEGLQVEDVAGVENNVGATNSEDLKKKKITKAKSDERIAGGRNDTAMPIRAVNPDISVSEKSWSKRYLSSERRRMWGIVVFDAVVQFIIFILILVYTNLFSVDHTRLKSLCTLHQNAVRTSALAMETKNVDYQLWDENEVLSTALAESTNMFEASTTLFLNTWLYVRGDVEVLVKGGQGVDACLSYNKVCAPTVSTTSPTVLKPSPLEKV